VTTLPRTPFEVFIEDTLWKPDRLQVQHQIRVYVLERAAALELELDEVLAASLASSLSADQVLRSDVLWRLPIPVRLELLKELLDRREMQDRWPFVLPVLRAFFDLRHALAHGLVSPARKPADGIRVMSVKRGHEVNATYPKERLEWLAWQAHVVSSELAQMWAVVAPAHRAWDQSK
jgi:hypothetical protein